MAAVAVDLSKAFHAICHNLLLLKMKAYGVRDYASKLIQSYLSVRFKRVKCNGKVSDWLPLRCEVPQGSLLGPLFYNAFVNDINYPPPPHVYMLMTQCNIYSPWKPLHSWIYIESSKGRLTLWFTANHLKVNAAKTQAMTLGKSQYPYNIFIGDRSIENEQLSRFLALHWIGICLSSPTLQSCWKSVCQGSRTMED